MSWWTDSERWTSLKADISSHKVVQMCTILPRFSVLGIFGIMLLHLGSSLRRHGQFARHQKLCSSTSSSSLAAAPPLTVDPAYYPKLFVFDLDNTLWTPELYTLRHISQDQCPSADVDVKLFEAARIVLEELSSAPKWKDCLLYTSDAADD